ncbi:hypothetical protein [Leptolyngbya sp. CCY15150]|uniref:hypothetical protein n=1 Tax=Leptolyngbya sp. CCY15150 TaxID=2767772 RepID=UPI0019501DDE|nr:hypothetical protein [Leptolyngbya sp. CCY15150]
MTPDEVMRFGIDKTFYRFVGEGLYISPDFKQYLIHYAQVPIPKRDRYLKKECEGLWETSRDRAIKRENSRQMLSSQTIILPEF